MLYFWGCSVYAVLAPFFPPIAISKGMSTQEVGYVFSLYAFVAFLFSPVSGKIMNKIGRKNVLLIGGIIESLSMLMFAFVVDLDGKTFVFFSILARMLMGAGGSALLVTCFAVISNIFPEDMETKIGIMETLGGVGLMFGPAFGGVLYAWFGYKFVIFFYVAVFASLTLVAFRILPQDNPEPQKEGHNVSYAKLISIKKIYLTLIIVIFGMSGQAFLEPVLADNLQKSMKLSPLWIGIYFALPTLSYTVAMKLLTMIPKSVDRRHVLFTGLLIEATSFIVLGPWTVLGKPSWVFTGFGLLLLGFGSAWAYIPSLPYLIDSASEELINFDKERLSNGLSTLMGTTHYLGETLGPIVGGISCNQFGYENGYAFFGLMIFCYFIFYGVANKEFSDLFKGQIYLEDGRKLEMSEIGNEKGSQHDKYEVIDYIESQKS
jgi:MFS transporter, DHA1 family, solute carrier family 18 (vesicular amine transporter), member 1/2